MSARLIVANIGRPSGACPWRVVKRSPVASRDSSPTASISVANGAPFSSGSTLVLMPPSQRWTVSSPRTRSRVMNVVIPRISSGIAANAG